MEEFDKPNRVAAPDLALFDSSDEDRRLRRALAQTERLQRRSLADFAKHRAADAAPAQPQAESVSPPITAARSEPESTPSPAQSEPEPTPSPTLRMRPVLDLDLVTTTFLPLRITPPKHS